MCSCHTQCQDPSYYAVPPTPTITQNDMKSIVILSLFTRCSMGRLIDSDVYPTNRQMQCTWEIWAKKKTKKSLFIHIPFPLGEYQPQRKPLPVYISWLQILPEFLFGMQPLEQTGSPQRMWSLSPPKLEVWWDAGHQDTLLGPSTWLLHLSFPFQNFKRISRHWSLHRRWFISWSCGFMAMILKLSIRSPGKPKKDTSSFSPTSTSLVPALFLSSQGDFDTHQSLRTTTVSH